MTAYCCHVVVIIEIKLHVSV